jgi:hypothetical protein
MYSAAKQQLEQEQLKKAADANLQSEALETAKKNLQHVKAQLDKAQEVTADKPFLLNGEHVKKLSKAVGDALTQYSAAFESSLAAIQQLRSYNDKTLQKAVCDSQSELAEVKGLLSEITVGLGALVQAKTANAEKERLVLDKLLSSGVL